MKFISPWGLPIQVNQTEYQCSFIKPDACVAKIQHTRMICDHLIEFRARNPLYFKNISIYFKIRSKLFQHYFIRYMTSDIGVDKNQ